MRELAKAVVAISAIVIIVVTGFDHGMDGDMARVAILAVSAVALGADAVTEWLEGRKAKSDQ